MPRPRVLVAMDPAVVPHILTPRIRTALEAVAEVAAPLADDFSRADVRAALRDTEVLFTCWGCPPLDETVLAAAPALRAVVHAAGTVRHHVTEACWSRGIAVTSAVDANSVPVAEFAVAAILLSNKGVLRARDLYRARRGEQVDWRAELPYVGNYRRTVGLVGASRIGRRVIELLRPYDLTVLVHDPHLGLADATALGVRLVGLDELCAASDVVSIHAPELPATFHMIDRGRLKLMRDGATLVNTARGSLVDQDALLDELLTGRLSAVLDTTTPEILPPGSPLYDLPNVLLTPHFAGSMGTEVQRMADAAVAEVARYAAGLPFAHPVRHEQLAHSA
ncbi:hydroxyacid dehydrogenase [Catellatospora vulcania]|uniref:hydroxyacid dehydrogenase n=1 Tax=Catellatospora vulcania TaxID=1460450 RepID=UPI0012D43443|nr:hydroxyacid dehydrogenase [Catellatospora vulcania]